MVVFEDGEPYLARFYVSQRESRDGISVYVHRFFRSDAEDTFHNHPWDIANCLVLTGGYREHVLGLDNVISSRTYMPGDVNVIYPGTFHRTELLGGPTWTLVSAKGDSEEWGFRTETADYEPWQIRNARVKPEKSIEIMDSSDERLRRYAGAV